MVSLRNLPSFARVGPKVRHAARRLMCLILFAAHAHPDYALIVAANRDEAYARPTARAAFWEDDPGVCAGRDLEQGGTWLGIARTGRFAAITNYRQGQRSDAARSRGELTRSYLGGAERPLSYLRGVEERAQNYNGFSLIVGDVDELWFYSNRSTTPQRVAAGVHGLSNHLLDEPWPKVRRGVSALASLMHACERELTARLFDLLTDRTPAPDHLLPSTGIALERERALSASFIAGDAYGTRASTVLLVSSEGHVIFRERSYGPGGVFAGESEQRFRLELKEVLNKGVNPLVYRQS
jgi:uncharacterized protein with NRDE domain